MLDQFKQHLEQKQFWRPEDAILVGYSGGADSTCLLHMLAKLGVQVVGAHLHHGQRGEADQELNQCAEFCNAIGVPFLVGYADVPRIAADKRVGLEEAGRIARYAFFESALEQTGCAVVATAHTKDDLLETVVLNIARGSGLAGIAGIPERRDNIIRPLLTFRRNETRGYCAEHYLWTHDDPSNTDEQFSRARVRHRIVPELLTLNSDVHGAVARLARIADEEERFLNGVAASALERANIRINEPFEFLTVDCESAFSRQQLSVLPRTVFRRALRLVIGVLGGEISFEGSESLLEQLTKSESGSWTAMGATPICEWAGDLVHVRAASVSACPRILIEVPGRAENAEGDWAVETRVVSPTIEGTANTANLDSAQIKGKLHIRAGQPSDKWQPLGLQGHKGLMETLAELKLTEAGKKRLPVVFDMIGPIWVPGKGIADRVQITPDSKSALNLRLTCLSQQGEP